MAYPPNIINLLPSGTTSSAAPSATDETAGTALPFGCDQVLVLLKSTAGSGTMTASCRAWGFNLYLDKWYSIGLLNAGADLAEVASDSLSHAELLTGMHGFNRLYIQVISLGGSNTAIQVDGVCRRAETASR